MPDESSPSPPRESLDATLRQPGPLAALGSVLDVLDEGVVLLQSSELPCYRNAAAAVLLEQDSEAELIEDEMRALSRLAKLDGASGAAVERRVRTADASYRLRAKLLRPLMSVLQGRTVVVLIDRLSRPLPSAAALMRRYWLTAREAEVALLLARGLRNSEVARELGLSPNTTRHYTESVLVKFAVHARADVARAVQSFGATDAAGPRAPAGSR